MPEAIQRHLEQGLNHDLSRVRIHDDAEADGLAKGVNAIAFTTGTDIFFQSGKFSPNTQSGLELLAHEVTHTVQQSQGRVGPGVDPDAGLEAEARSMGRALAQTGQTTRPATLRKAGSTAAPPRMSTVQRRATPTSSAPTAEQHVAAFKAKLKQAALKTLSQNEQRLLGRQKVMARTSPDNPAWTALHLVAQKNAQIERTWQSLVAAVEKQVLAAGSDAVRPLMNPALRMR
ncbi:eCIS core domain-containing protein, partial [Deinococcus arboris]|uniref:eCIS core domain-containing protein n=1 Tax=Deinococcus arboris TaxID=2682977 RepID=UPI001E5121ED